MTDKRVKIIKINKSSVKFEVDSRYSPLESIGTGAYGVVCAAKDNRTGQRVAIKKIPRVFEVIVIAKRTYRELKILRHLRHENIISILDVMQPPEDMSLFEDVYVVLDLMESDLHHIIHSVQPLSDEHIKFFLYQILRGLKYIHSANVLHRDLKPSNLLVNRNCELKIGDFGMARGLSSSPDEHATFMTEYVATRWYRAPELMLSFSEYTFAIDIWSVGCILAEMLARRQLFPGKDYLNQLQLILSVVGTPDVDYIQGVGSDRVKTYLQNLPSRKRVDLTVLFPNSSQVALELLGNMLQLDPNKRLSSEEALAHKYFSQYHDPKDEPVCNPPFDFDFEKELVTQDDLCKAIVGEIMDYHKSRMPIPSQDKVKDALKKKMMEEREKEREKVEKEIEDGGQVAKEIKDVKEVPGKIKKGKASKKRKQPTMNQTEQKKFKLEEEEEGMTDNDKTALCRWVDIQQQTRPFIHPIRKLVKPGVSDPMYMQQQETIIKEQHIEIEKLQQQVMEYEKITKEKNALISTLTDKHKAIVLECQAAGMHLPQNLLDNLTPKMVSMASSLPSLVPIHPNSLPAQHPRLPPPPLPSTATMHTSKLTPASPANIFSPPPPVYPNISPTNRTPPPITAQVPSRAHLPPVHPIHRSPVSIVPLSSSCNKPHNSSASTYHLNPRVMMGLPPPPPPPPPPQQNRYTALSQSQLVMVGGHTGHVQNPMEISQVPCILSSSHQPYRTARKNDSGLILMDDLSFSPLTSSELKELDQPPSMGGTLYQAPPLISFSDDLDTILNITMPSGSGAGYGVGVKEEELPRGPPQIDLSDLGTTPPGPPSASLLRDWLDVSQLDPDDMDVLQKELETGAPDVFSIHDFTDL